MIRLWYPRNLKKIAAAFEKYGFASMTGGVELLNGRCSHYQLHLYREIVQRNVGE